MKERPILFSAPMVRAILDGRKTQTRRVVKFNDAGRLLFSGKQWHINDPGVIKGCPHGQPGDRLWVRETLSAVRDQQGYISDYQYSADGAKVLRMPGLRAEFGDAMAFAHVSRPAAIPSIHMPRWASRITLEITGVRVERLNEISEADAIAEGAVFTDFGIEPPKGSISLDGGRTFHPVVRGTQRNGWHMGDATSHTRCMGSARYAFANLINRLHGGENWNLKGAGLWESNPWVWVIEFKRIEENQS
ncbi:hypothetical protein [Burkholderia glumae]|uniref:hypothetical protein n=1 Tax=Burkholderia glumae TaxID=337 RepID=UPI00214FD619|nr:hypothetical protein [Burkholderia glumae]